MKTNWFIIYEALGAWWIDNEGTDFGPFTSREVAGVEALTIAQTFGRRDRRNLVFWPDENGKQQLAREVL